MQRFKKLIFLLLAHSIVFNSIAHANTTQDCQSVLNWIYKELTLNNLDKSVKRLNRKLEASFLYALKNSESQDLRFKNNPELLSLF
jgi:hypothetical protein